jgi:hypothetical protein
MHPLFAIPAAILGYFLGRKSADKKATSKTAGAGAPLDDVTLGAWESFVAEMAKAPKASVGRKGKLGAFQIDARKLADVGAMSKAWKKPDGSWTGSWSAGLTESAFLGSMPLQYAVFVRSMRAAAPKVSSLVGAKIDGKPASLSGLLGVSHVAGERGVASFVRDADVRARFPATSEVFGRTNGIF